MCMHLKCFFFFSHPFCSLLVALFTCSCSPSAGLLLSLPSSASSTCTPSLSCFHQGHSNYSSLAISRSPSLSYASVCPVFWLHSHISPLIYLAALFFCILSFAFAFLSSHFLSSFLFHAPFLSFLGFYSPLFFLLSPFSISHFWSHSCALISTHYSIQPFSPCLCIPLSLLLCSLLLSFFSHSLSLFPFIPLFLPLSLL